MNIQDVPHVVLVASGKGGVGKTTVASDIARVASDLGHTVGLIDADISTPNTPEVVGGENGDLSDQRLSTGDALIPPKVNGIQLVSQGTVLPDDVPILRDGEWRATAVADYMENVEWDDDTDLVVVDTPPGTGEELQIIASVAPVEHSFVVSTPHPSSVRDATKTHEFFKQADVDHSLIINMAYIPGPQVASAATEGVDLTDINNVGDNVAQDIATKLTEETGRFPLFGYDGTDSLDIPVEVTTTLPYTPDFEARTADLRGIVDAIVGQAEVEA